MISVAEKAKQDKKTKRVRPTVSTDLPVATDSQGASTDSQGASTDSQSTATDSQSVATSNLDDSQGVATSNLDLVLLNSPVQESSDRDPMTPSTLRVLETIVTPQPRRKKQLSIPTDTGSPLRSRNASPSMQNLMAQETEIGQRTGRPRRDSAICVTNLIFEIRS